jgi:hypothetical protein
MEDVWVVCSIIDLSASSVVEEIEDILQVLDMGAL